MISKKQIAFFFFAFLSSLIQAGSKAQPECGKEYWDTLAIFERSPKVGIDRLIDLANSKKNICAIERLFSIYYFGLENSKDEIRALYWLQIGAEAGNSKMQYTLGQKFLSGISLQKNETYGVMLIQDAARKGDPDAKWFVQNNPSFQLNNQMPTR